MAKDGVKRLYIAESEFRKRPMVDLGPDGHKAWIDSQLKGAGFTDLDKPAHEVGISVSFDENRKAYVFEQKAY